MWNPGRTPCPTPGSPRGLGTGWQTHMVDRHHLDHYHYWAVLRTLAQRTEKAHRHRHRHHRNCSERLQPPPRPLPLLPVLLPPPSPPEPNNSSKHNHLLVCTRCPGTITTTATVTTRCQVGVNTHSMDFATKWIGTWQTRTYGGFYFVVRPPLPSPDKPKIVQKRKHG